MIEELVATRFADLAPPALARRRLPAEAAAHDYADLAVGRPHSARKRDKLIDLTGFGPNRQSHRL
jgi:hypothetical protein